MIFFFIYCTYNYKKYIIYNIIFCYYLVKIINFYFNNFQNIYFKTYKSKNYNFKACKIIIVTKIYKKKRFNIKNIYYII